MIKFEYLINNKLNEYLVSFQDCRGKIERKIISYELFKLTSQNKLQTSIIFLFLGKNEFKKVRDVQQNDFSRGHSSYYYSCPNTLNCEVLMRFDVLMLV